MSTKFQHDVDKIVAKVLWANRGLGSDPAPWELFSRAAKGSAPKGTMPTGTWPVFDGGEPEEPNNVITVYETTPQHDARIMVTGEQMKHYGFTVRVRGATKSIAKQKARDIEHDFNESFLDQQVTLDSTQYLIPSISKAMVIPFGFAAPGSRLYLVNVNCLAPITAYPLTYSPPAPDVLTGLGGAWRYDNDFLDSSGNGRTMTPAGAAFTTSGIFVVQGTHALLEGAGSVVWGGPAATLANTSLTMSYWVTKPGTSNPVAFNNVGWTGVLQVKQFEDATGGLSVYVGGTKVRPGVLNDVPTLTKTHVALTWNHATGGWELWRNGFVLANGTIPGQTANVAASSFEVFAGNTFASTHTPLDITLAYARKLTDAGVAYIATPATADPTA